MANDQAAERAFEAFKLDVDRLVQGGLTHREAARCLTLQRIGLPPN